MNFTVVTERLISIVSFIWFIRIQWEKIKFELNLSADRNNEIATSLTLNLILHVMENMLIKVRH